MVADRVPSTRLHAHLDPIVAYRALSNETMWLA
jgi:hypothetical protein